MSPGRLDFDFIMPLIAALYGDTFPAVAADGGLAYILLICFFVFDDCRYS